MKQIQLMITVAGIMSLLLVVPAHAAVPGDADALTLQRDRNDILWAELSLDTAAGTVRVYLRAPGKDRRTVKWQQCRFGGTTAGIYRCGIDVATGSPAAMRTGTWTARATVGRATVARASFELRI